MAQKVNVLLVDDIDGSDADETMQFGLDGTHYEIDLNSDHAQELRGQLERYVKAARKVTGSAGRSARVRRTTANDAKNKEIRNWARERHLDVNERGRIPADIMAQYEAANGK
jgi:Lsr2